MSLFLFISFFYSSVNRENEAFESLIRQKSMVVMEEDLDQDHEKELEKGRKVLFFFFLFLPFFSQVP